MIELIELENDIGIKICDCEKDKNKKIFVQVINQKMKTGVKLRFPKKLYNKDFSLILARHFYKYPDLKEAIEKSGQLTIKLQEYDL